MTMRFLSIALAIISSCQFAFAQQVKNPEIKFLVDTTVAIMQKNAVNAGKVDWVKTRQNALADAATLDNPYQLGNTIRALFKAIGDFHGAFFYRDSTFQWHGRSVPASDSVRKQWNKRAGIKTALLPNSIGYLRIPSIIAGSRDDFSAKGQALNDSLCKILSANTKGIILDLRINGGGAMHPMMIGVEQLLGNGKIGSFETNRNQDWVIKDNALYVDTIKQAWITPKCTVDAASVPVVLLVGYGTGSSGEFLSMAFKGRKNTVFIGTETAGYITVNIGLPIKDLAFLNLAVGYGKDRNGITYTEALKPDIYLKATENFDNLKEDEAVKAAIKWLSKH